MNHSSVRTTEWLLVNWARWAYFNRGLSVAWSSMTPFERMAHERMGDAPPAPEISDADAAAVDRAVSELCMVRRAEGDALGLKFLCQMTYRDIGKELGRPHQVAAQMVDSGKMWVEGRLAGILS